LRQAAQNPVADLISLPFQNNTSSNVGKLDKADQAPTAFFGAKW